MHLTLSDTKIVRRGGIPSQATKADTGIYGNYFLVIKDISTNTFMHILVNVGLYGTSNFSKIPF